MTSLLAGKLISLQNLICTSFIVRRAFGFLIWKHQCCFLRTKRWCNLTRAKGCHARSAHPTYCACDFYLRYTYHYFSSYTTHPYSSLVFPVISLWKSSAMVLKCLIIKSHNGIFDTTPFNILMNSTFSSQ